MNKKIFALLSGIVLTTSLINIEVSAEVLNYANNGKTMPWVFMGYPSGWGENVVGADIQKYLDGSMSWEDLVKNAQKTL